MPRATDNEEMESGKAWHSTNSYHSTVCLTPPPPPPSCFVVVVVFVIHSCFPGTPTILQFVLLLPLLVFLVFVSFSWHSYHSSVCPSPVRSPSLLPWSNSLSHPSLFSPQERASERTSEWCMPKLPRLIPRTHSLARPWVRGSQLPLRHRSISKGLMSDKLDEPRNKIGCLVASLTPLSLVVVSYCVATPACMVDEMYARLVLIGFVRQLLHSRSRPHNAHSLMKDCGTRRAGH